MVRAVAQEVGACSGWSHRWLWWWVEAWGVETVGASEVVGKVEGWVEVAWLLSCSLGPWHLQPHHLQGVFGPWHLISVFERDKGTSFKGPTYGSPPKASPDMQARSQSSSRPLPQSPNSEVAARLHRPIVTLAALARHWLLPVTLSSCTTNALAEEGASCQKSVDAGVLDILAMVACMRSMKQEASMRGDAKRVRGMQG